MTRSKRYRLRHPERVKASQKKYELAHHNELLSKNRLWRKTHPDYQRTWNLKRPGKNYQYWKKWAAKSRAHINRYERNRCATVPSYHLGKRLRSRIRYALRRAKAGKTTSALALTGCSIAFLVEYLKSKFLAGMSWENYGKMWEVDHKRPCAAFNLSDPSQQHACFHYSNLQPLFVGDNRRKNYRITI